MPRPHSISFHYSLSALNRYLLSAALAFALIACTEQGNEAYLVDETEVAIRDEAAATKVETSLGNPKSDKPNILLVMADDLGYSDIGVFGGEIDTPYIDSLAKSGVQMLNFYSSLTCSPSRAMLMAGADNHLAGLGNMDETLADNQIGLPGYEGYLNQRVLSLAEALKIGGYKTYMAGKWHLGMAKEQGPAARGFDESFALLLGGASHYDNSFGPDIHRTKALYRDNGRLLERAPKGFFSSAYYTDRIIENISSSKNEGPFFAYLSFTAPHWPLQLPPNYSGKYSQTYSQGWHAIRQRRFARQKELGLVSAADEMTPTVGNWEELSDQEKAISARKMEIYAAMVDDLDQNLGRLISHLKSAGLYENTVIVFLSDNGAGGWGNTTAPPAISDWAARFNNEPENAGQPDSYILYGKQWATVSNTPYKHGKGNASEGGIRVPMIIQTPAHVSQQLTSGKSMSITGIEDVMPTLLELAGLDQQTFSFKKNQVRITGNSFADSLMPGAGLVAEQVADTKIIGRELWGKQGLRVGNWKLLNQPPPNGSGEWQLYNLNDDLAEQNDLASIQPQKLNEMLGIWQNYMNNNNVVLPEGEFRVRETSALPTE